MTVNNDIDDDSATKHSDSQKRHHWGVRFYRLLDVGLQCVLQYSAQSRAKWYLELFSNFISGRRTGSSR